MDQSERGAREDLPAPIFRPNGFSFFAFYKEVILNFWKHVFLRSLGVFQPSGF